MLMIMFIIFLMTVLFLFMKHPLSMGIVLILQTIMISMFTGTLIKSFWFSYMLVMILLSGALVLFIYMASIASNEKFYSSTKLTMTMTMFMMITIIMYFMIDEILKNNISDSINNFFMENNQTTTLIKMFNLQNMQMTLMLVVYLLFTMIVVTYNVNIYEGPMRAKS
uniref:NADH-ubiquinone oxidoreductase chain 6 n=1 Tax=Macrosaldula sp. PJ-2017 TaxID=2021942 RepID=A0A343ISD6_9HEMI|nr:NADH dehydrogenase subunit 6 [Macrosaldula sp. PJ-2017]AST10161.1 NADH dehydrogenase subunit 6 [Macrosaldula sp. PJ-2017]